MFLVKGLDQLGAAYSALMLLYKAGKEERDPENQI